MELDLRLVRSFAVVAEHGHFGRAADALHLAQPALSRQVRRLEDQLGVRLLDRTPQGARLTEAGEVFLAEARALLRQATQAVALTQAAARPTTLVLGFAPHLIVTPIVHTLRRRHPAAEIVSRHVAWNAPHVALLDHAVDAAVARAPFPPDGLDVIALYEEPRVLVVPRTHPLAGAPSATLDDIAHEPLPRVPDPLWDAFWRIDPRPDGRPAPDGPLVHGMEDKYELIADGQAVGIVPASIQGSALRPDLTTVPLEGVEPTAVVLITRTGERSELLDDLRAVAVEHFAAAEPII